MAGSGSAEREGNGGSNGGGKGRRRKGPTLKERLMRCLRTERERITFGKVHVFLGLGFISGFRVTLNPINLRIQVYPKPQNRNQDQKKKEKKKTTKIMQNAVWTMMPPLWSHTAFTRAVEELRGL